MTASAANTWLGPSPRVRGSRFEFVQEYPRARSIPACAGEPVKLAERCLDLAVHPRVCGGAEYRTSPPTSVKGPSPRVRGSLRIHAADPHGHGSIPACAGEPAVQDEPCDRVGVHPRVCGGASRLRRRTLSPGGPSPRVRGSLGRRTAELPYQRSIPACAGEPRTTETNSSSIGVHPRVCGGAILAEWGDPRPRGPSPRVRGSRRTRHR